MDASRIRRPRRITGPAEATPEAAADRHQADRFQRALSGTRRDWRGERLLLRPPGEGPAPSPLPPLQGPGEAGPHGQPAAAAARPQATQARRPVARREGSASTASDTARTDVEAPRRVERAAAAGHPPEPSLALGLAQSVCMLCDRADPVCESLSVLVPLDTRVLPETELRLTLTPHRLSLRFEIGCSISQHLVSLHQKPLLEMLTQALGDRRDIDIELA